MEVEGEEDMSGMDEPLPSPWQLGITLGGGINWDSSNNDFFDKSLTGGGHFGGGINEEWDSLLDWTEIVVDVGCSSLKIAGLS